MLAACSSMLAARTNTTKDVKKIQTKDVIKATEKKVAARDKSCCQHKFSILQNHLYSSGGEMVSGCTWKCTMGVTRPSSVPITAPIMVRHSTISRRPSPVRDVFSGRRLAFINGRRWLKTVLRAS